MNKLSRSVLICAAALQMQGCATNPDGSQSRTTTGAAAGALVGGVLAALAGGDKKAVLTAAVAGAAVGALVGNYQDRQVASRAEAAQRYALANQPRLEVESNLNNPRRAAAGSAVESQVGYTVLAPGNSQDMAVVETRRLVKGAESYPLSKRDIVRPQGTHVSTLKFTLPKDLPAGEYSLVTTIASGALTRTVQSPLSVV
jgi:hypothetical protein